jgi:hypothetical protein
VHEVYRQVAQFHARPLDEKLKIKLDKHNVGYLPMMGDTRRTAAARGQAETFLERPVFGIKRPFSNAWDIRGARGGQI